MFLYINLYEVVNWQVDTNSPNELPKLASSLLLYSRNKNYDFRCTLCIGSTMSAHCIFYIAEKGYCNMLILFT